MIDFKKIFVGKALYRVFDFAEDSEILVELGTVLAYGKGKNNKNFIIFEEDEEMLTDNCYNFDMIFENYQDALDKAKQLAVDHFVIAKEPR